MILVNETSLPAALLSTVIDDDRIAASVLVRVTYRLEKRAGGALEIDAEQPWLVSGAPQKTAYGTMEAETPFVKGGVDLFLFGAARAPGKVPVSQLEVTMRVGDFERRANVFGERLWLRKNGKQLEASRPGVFVEMPLVPANAFGGAVTWDGLEVPFMENPAGKGFCIAEKEAEGRSLPNLEEPGSPMTAWNAQPVVCGFGFCPAANTARFRNGWEMNDAQTELAAVRPASLNTAFPPMIAPQARPGDAVHIEGVDHDGPVTFALPEPPAAVRLSFGATEVTRIPTIDQVGVLVDERRVFVTYRFPFRYVVRPREKRGIHLIARGVTSP